MSSKIWKFEKGDEVINSSLSLKGVILCIDFDDDEVFVAWDTGIDSWEHMSRVQKFQEIAS